MSLAFSPAQGTCLPPLFYQQHIHWLEQVTSVEQVTSEECVVPGNVFVAGSIDLYFIVSGEICLYLMKIKVVSITSELISYHFTSD